MNGPIEDYIPECHYGWATLTASAAALQLADAAAAVLLVSHSHRNSSAPTTF